MAGPHYPAGQGREPGLAFPWGGVDLTLFLSGSPPTAHLQITNDPRAWQMADALSAEIWNGECRLQFENLRKRSVVFGVIVLVPAIDRNSTIGH